jgi:P27 family predicted phage terminase small subunit
MKPSNRPVASLAPVEAIPPPDHLSDRCKALWASVLHDWLLEDHAVELLRLALEALDRAEEARRIVDAEGPVVYSSTGRPAKHPAVTIVNDCSVVAARLFRELGLDLPNESRPPRRGGSRW